MVAKMKQEDFKDLQALQDNIMKKDNSIPPHISEATAFMFNNEELCKMNVKYFYCDVYSSFTLSSSERKNIQHRTILHSTCL